jgi:hypothetical protein
MKAYGAVVTTAHGRPVVHCTYHGRHTTLDARSAEHALELARAFLTQAAARDRRLDVISVQPLAAGGRTTVIASGLTPAEIRRRYPNAQ